MQREMVTNLIVFFAEEHVFETQGDHIRALMILPRENIVPQGITEK
jgi:hypothetical protein